MKMRKKKHIKRHPPKQYPLIHREATPEMLEKVKQLMDNLSKKLLELNVNGKPWFVGHDWNVPHSQQRSDGYAS